MGMKIRNRHPDAGCRRATLFLVLIYALLSVLPAGAGARADHVYGFFSTRKILTKELVSEGDLRVTVSYEEEDRIPDGTELRAVSVEDGGEYAALAAGKMGVRQAAFLQLFDLSLVYEDQEIQPQGKVTVKVSLPEAVDREIRIIHFTGAGEAHSFRSNAKTSARRNDTADTVTAELLEAAVSGNEVTFETDGFSVYGIAYTVEFHYGTDGESFDYSMPGGGAVSLKALLEAAGAMKDSGLTPEEFMAAIGNAAFSRPDLVSVSRVEEKTTAGAIAERLGLQREYSAELTEKHIALIDATPFDAGDWAMISLKPFDTEETLTVTMDNGEKFTLKVTDAQIQKIFITDSGETYRITVTYDKYAGIPEDAELHAREILPGTEESAEYLRKASGKLGGDSLILFARFFDIEIRKDGEKLEPLTPVQVQITYIDAPEIGEDDRLSVVHFAEGGTEIIDSIDVSGDGKTVSYTQDGFSVTGTVVTGYPNNGEALAVGVEQDGHYYVVLSDGTLDEIFPNAGGQSFEMNFPMLWTYDSNGPHLYHNAFTKTTSGAGYAETFYRRFLDPGDPDGVVDEVQGSGQSVDSQNQAIWNNSALTYDAGTAKLRRSGTNWYLGVTGVTGEKRVIGQVSANEAATVFLLRASEVAAPHSWGQGDNHTVNHIDISVNGTVELTIPLAYGTYYYDDGTEAFTVNAQTSAEMSRLTMRKPVIVTAEDMKKARIVTYTKDGSGNHTLVDDAFYITGYSENTAVSNSSAQVRIDGAFKIANLSGNCPWWADESSSQYAQQRHLANRIYYDLTVTKKETFDFEYNGRKLYASPSAEEPIHTTASVRMAGTFDYWDSRNECPGLHTDPFNPGSSPIHGDWYRGGIVALGSSGMDFKIDAVPEELGGAVAVEINKYVTDPLGNVLDLQQTSSSEFEVWVDNMNQDASNSQELMSKPAAVEGLNRSDSGTVQSYSEYSGVYTGEYVKAKDLTVSVGRNGKGNIFEYDIDPGMVYIREKESSIPATLTGSDGMVWVYDSTRIETEYVWRANGDSGVRHVSDTYKAGDAYRSIPDVVGAYRTRNGSAESNSFLDFHIYNIYKRIEDVPVEKVWENGDPVSGAEVTVTLGRYKLKPDGTAPGTLLIQDSATGLGNGVSYSATYRITGPNGFDRTVTGNGSQVAVEGVPPGEYTVTKTAQEIDGYTIASNGTGTATVTVPTRGSGTAYFNPTVYVASSQSSYRVVGKWTGYPDPDRPWLETYWYNEQYFPANSRVTFRVGVPSWMSNNGRFSYSTDGGATFTDIPAGSVVERTFTLDRDYQFEIKYTKVNAEWAPDYNGWLVPEPTITVVTSNSRGIMLRNAGSRAAGSQAGADGEIHLSSSDPTLPDPPQYFEYELDTEFSESVTLTQADGWTKTVEDLPSVEENGEYVYFISSVSETGVPEGTYATVTNEVFSFSGQQTLTVTNRLPSPTSVNILKTDGTDPLPDAQFALYRCSDSSYTVPAGAEGDIKTTDGSGSLSYTGLMPGYYVIRETQAPAGHIGMTETIRFRVSVDSSQQTVIIPENIPDAAEYGDQTFTVVNTPGRKLPSTGGPGTAMIYLAGIIMILGAGALLCRRAGRRRE